MAYFPLQRQYDTDIHQLTDIFCQVDGFCNTLDTYTQDYITRGAGFFARSRQDGRRLHATNPPTNSRLFDNW